MIRSMTAFAREQSQGEWGSLTCEMRSINHRYLETNLYLSDVLRVFEMPVREQVKKALKRGKVEVSLRYRSVGGSAASAFSVNKDLVKELSKASEEIASVLVNPAPITIADVMRFPGVMESKEADQEVLKKEVSDLVAKTLEELIAAREREGSELNKIFQERMECMETEMSKVRERVPDLVKEAADRIQKRFTDAQVDLDPARLEQEMVIFAHKIDIAEEIDRTNTHINEVRRILKNGGLAGRRLDFLMQELNREANTMGSKSTDSVITHAAVEMKVLIEQVREQVQNIE